jgi:excisionase family DNA binding protein
MVYPTGVGETRDTAQDAAQDRVTIQEAAERLGVKEDAIRKRIQRRSLRHEKAEDGRVYVWVDEAQDTTQDGQEKYRDTTQDTAQDGRLEDLQEQVAYLRRQLDEEREARRRADMIIAQLSQANAEQARAIRAIEAPQETTETAEAVEEEPERQEPRLSTAAPQSPPQGTQGRGLRGLRRRILGW